MKRLFLLVFLAAPAGAATTLEDDAMLWAPVFATFERLAGPTATLEVNPRVRGDMRRLTQLLVRPWLGYRLDGGWTLHAGYGWIRNDSGRAIDEEHRAWQQATKVWQPGPVRLTARARLEQRFLDRDPETGHRARLMLRAERRLGTGPCYWALFSETFQNLDATRRTRSGFDQHRAFAGLGLDRGGPVRVEAGYQNVHRRFASTGAYDNLHVLLANTYLKFGGK